MSTRAMTTASLAQFVVPLLFAVAVTACGSAKGRCNPPAGEGLPTPEFFALGTQITESACRDLCQEQFMRDDCAWTETIISERIVGPE